MKFIYGRQDFKTFERGQENCFLMTNGLGGFSSMTMIGSCGRNDHALLMSCEKEEAPNHRMNMIHRLKEEIKISGEILTLSSQEFEQGEKEEGYKYLSTFTYEDYPVWHYVVEGVEVIKTIVLSPNSNTVGIEYDIRNRTEGKISLTVTPELEFVPKGSVLEETQKFTVEGSKILSNGRKLHYDTNGEVKEFPTIFSKGLYYAYDACDGRKAEGVTAAVHSVCFKVPAGKHVKGYMIYSTGKIKTDFKELKKDLKEYRADLKEKSGLKDRTAVALAQAANQFVAYRASTDQQTILAGFPFFEDWGRDTMISLPGCCLATRQYDTAVAILRTFMANERNGLMPNLFPEGGKEPWYNTVDAALLFIITVYEYMKRTGDRKFVAECYPVMKRIIDGYMKGTEFNIGMDEEDGLIHAGAGFDQVTWMDVRIGDILPTPRHGKPVEINAYWYNCLKIMDQMREIIPDVAGSDTRDYAAMAKKVKKSFNEKFWNEKANCLKDVVSEDAKSAAESGKSAGADACKTTGTERSVMAVDHDLQIRCNQIWAVSMPFSILPREKEEAVVECVFRKLYTPLGLRTLDPADPEFKPVYTGEMMDRDLAYHQGTVWAFPLGAYYLAYLKVNDYSDKAKARVRNQLKGTTAALREGCIGQLAEIYDGGIPTSSKGCFAQAWSTGELLRAFEAVEK